MTLSYTGLLPLLKPWLKAPRWLVAYSGGVDSHVLLHLLTQLSAQRGEHCPPLGAVHINHQLQPEADHWTEHCQQQCDQLNVPLTVQTVTVHRQARQSPEEQARRARYQSFEEMLAEGELLLFAHHQDDQAETLLLRLLRGSGSQGAAAIPQGRTLGQGHLLRPLLDIPRRDIEAYAREQQLRWIEDPSNQSSAFDRNFLRHQLLPQFEERWPQYRKTLSRSADLMRESAELNSELAAIDLQSCVVHVDSQWLPINSLSTLSQPRQKNVLRYWLQQRGFQPPSAAQLQVIIDEVINARADAKPHLKLSDAEVHRFDGGLYVINLLPAVSVNESSAWQTSQLLDLPQGQLGAQPVTGHGLRYSAQLTVKYRQGGERCQPLGRNGSRSVKKLLQEYRVPPWLRDRLPLIYDGEQLVAVADLWICQGSEAKDGEAGLEISWQPA